MMDDEVGSLVEKLKPQFVTKWLKTVCDVRFDVMVMSLLPKPMEFARVRLCNRISSSSTFYVYKLYKCLETHTDILGSSSTA